jgi:hypothetical protein
MNAEIIQRIVPEDVFGAMGVVTSTEPPHPDHPAVVGGHRMRAEDSAIVQQWGNVLLRRGSQAAARLVPRPYMLSDESPDQFASRLEKYLHDARVKRNQFMRRAWSRLQKAA